MRKEWRNVLALLVLFLLGTRATVAQTASPANVAVPGEDVVRLTIEVSWSMPSKGTEAALDDAEPAGSGQDAEVLLKTTSGRVMDAVPWPPEARRGETTAASEAVSDFGPGSGGSWRLGRAQSGRVRARIEAPVDAGIVVHRGDQVVNVPLVAILDKAQHTPPQSRLVVSVERLAWDSLTVDFREPAADGVAAPGSVVPVSIGLNILWPEAAEVAVRTAAVLRSIRGGEVVWRAELPDRQVVTANGREPVLQTLNLPAPQSEGSYILELSASWELTQVREGSRIGRLIRRRRSAPAASSAVRRVVLTVVDPRARPAGALGREVEVDTLDLGRSRSLRPLASGRSPAAGPGQFAWAVPPVALIEPSRRIRLLGWIMRTNAEASKLDRADANGLAWSAVGLKVAHPDRPHRLTLKVRGGEPSALGVAVIEPGGSATSSAPRLLLDACASGPLILPDGPPAVFNWLVWPSSPEMVLVLVNHSSEAEVKLGNVALAELDELAAHPPTPAEPRGGASRGLGLCLSGPDALEPFEGGNGAHDALMTATNLAKYLGYCGATAVVVSEELADRSNRRALDGQADEDATGPDRLEMIWRMLARQRSSMWVELALDRPAALPGLPAADSAEALQRGLVRVNRLGLADAPVYHPLHPEVREAMKRRVTQALAFAKGGSNETLKNGGGVLVRLGPGPTLLGMPDTGLDDVTFERFVRETFSPETARSVPGLGTDQPDRFAVRSRYVAGVGRMPWLTWRSRSMAALYGELAAAARAAAPGATLAVVTPGLDSGAAGIEARRVDRAGLAPIQAWRSVGLDLQAWPNGPEAPAVLRGVSVSTDALAHDLATSPDLDALVAGRAHRGLLLSIEGESRPVGTAGGLATAQPGADELGSSSPPVATNDAATVANPAADAPAARTIPRGEERRVWLTALPLGDGPVADEPLGHSVAALDAHWVFLTGKVAAGQEERLRRFAGVLRALPAWAPVSTSPQADGDPKSFGITVRAMSDDVQTYLAIANDSPYPIRLASVLGASGSAPVDDLGRGVRLSPVAEAGGRKLVLDLVPFGIAAIHVGVPHVSVSGVTPYPSDAVLADMQARFKDLSAQLARLNRGLAAVASEPPNPGFEPDKAVANAPGDGAPPAAPIAQAEVRPAMTGWKLEGNKIGASTIAIDRDKPHTGAGSLRFTAAAGSVSVVSDPFVPDVRSSLTIQAVFRASSPAAKVRVWIEGEAGGRPFIRRTELVVSSEWEPRAVRASDIPPGGLDSARVRFELPGAGTLWVDDLKVVGEGSSKSARLNAQRTLLAALQAYREERYADFARLAGSHWIRESSVTASRLAVLPDRGPGSSGNGPASAPATALPPDRARR
jgi:hypothetical protein